MARRIGALLIVFSIGAIVIANAVVAEFAATSPQTAAGVWPSHPAVETSLAMQRIAQDAREGRPADGESLAMLQEAAERDAMAPEPFLAHGIAAESAGQLANAADSFKAAKLRDPRSLPARYFLAGLYLKSRDIRHGLEEVAGFANLSPGGIAAVGPYVAAVASRRSAWPELRSLFRQDRLIEQASLNALASDPANADTVLALQGGRRKAAEAPWISVLAQALVKAGQYERARAMLSAALDPALDSNALLVDQDFDHPDSPAPFNWTLASSTIGLAERQKGGRLHIIFYGQDDGALANQLIVLPPGRYRLSMEVSGGADALDAMAWTVRCANDSRVLLSAPLAARISAPFTVPANCPAQWIELTGKSGDIARTSDVTISGLGLERDGRGE